ncbi:MAG: trypsin-like serine protease [Bdellovibrionales bacterium]
MKFIGVGILCFLLSSVAYGFLPFAIVGGTIVEDGLFPEVVALNNCTAVVIQPKLLLTAAHCAENSVNFSGRGDRVILHIGRTRKFNRLNNSFRGRAYQVESMETHPDYDKRTARKDIAFIKLRRGLQVTPANLVLNPRIEIGQRIIAVGFGDHSDNRKKFAELEIERIGEEKIYTLEVNGVGTCDGDSGGPVYIQSNEGLKLIATTVIGPRDCGTEELTRPMSKFHKTYAGFSRPLALISMWTADKRYGHTCATQLVAQVCPYLYAFMYLKTTFACVLNRNTSVELKRM